jgi:hypothetical protein
MDRSLSRWPIIRQWWVDNWKEALLLSTVGLITAAIILTVLAFVFPIPGPS